MKSNTVIHPFAPVFDEDSEILILGSFPSVKSREINFYYGHPQNRFWKVMATLLSCPVPQTTEEKKQMLLQNHIALWDTLYSCEIKGSADSTIQNPVPNDIASLIKQSKISRIYFNGSTSGKLYEKYVFPKPDKPSKILPSTSPANARYSLDRLILLWGENMMEYLQL